MLLISTFIFLLIIVSHDWFKIALLFPCFSAVHYRLTSNPTPLKLIITSHLSFHFSRYLNSSDNKASLVLLIRSPAMRRPLFRCLEARGPINRRPPQYSAAELMMEIKGTRFRLIVWQSFSFSFLFNWLVSRTVVLRPRELPATVAIVVLFVSLRQSVVICINNKLDGIRWMWHWWVTSISSLSIGITPLVDHHHWSLPF